MSPPTKRRRAAARNASNTWLASGDDSDSSSSGSVASSSTVSTVDDSALIIVRQDSNSTERQTKLGVNKVVRVVVKNSPFSIVVSAPSLGAVFANHKLEGSLHYDVDGNDKTSPKEKPVLLSKSEPMSCKMSYSKDQMQGTAECRVRVLTSQHEGSNFRIKLALNNSSGEPEHAVFSEPIKVISKPDTARRRRPSAPKRRTVSDMLVDTLKRIERRQEEHSAQIRSVLVALNGDPTMLSAPSLSRSSSRGGGLEPLALASSAEQVRRFSSSSVGGAIVPSNSLLVGGAVTSVSFPNQFRAPGGAVSTGPPLQQLTEASIRQIRQQQQQQQQQQQPRQFQPTQRPQVNAGTARLEDKEKIDFEAAYIALLGVYEELEQNNSEHRHTIVRTVASAADLLDQYSIQEIQDQFYAQGLNELIGRSVTNELSRMDDLNERAPGCVCAMCPYAKELQRIEEFYQDLFSIGA